MFLTIESYEKMRVLKSGLVVIAILFIVFAGDESVEAGKRHRKNRRGDKQEQKRRHNRKGRKIEDRDAMTLQQKMMAQWQREGSHQKPTRKSEAQIEVEEWREAHIFAHSKNDSGTILHKTVGKVGYHSKSVDIVGKLVHIVDPNMKTHFGCADDIGNKKDIPKKGKWIALIERGKCYFFNKIRMAKLLKASAVIIYNHEEESQVMHTAGKFNRFLDSGSIFKWFFCFFEHVWERRKKEAVSWPLFVKTQFA